LAFVVIVPATIAPSTSPYLPESPLALESSPIQFATSVLKLPLVISSFTAGSWYSQLAAGISLPPGISVSFGRFILMRICRVYPP